LTVGHVRQAREHFPQVGVGIKTATPTAFDDGVEDGAALAGPGVADEEPVFLADGGGANGVFYQLLSASSRPSCRKTASRLHWFRV